MTARSMASLHGANSLGGVCSGHCAENDAAEPEFESWLRWLAAQRPEAWRTDARDAIFAAVRSRDLRAVEMLSATLGGASSEGLAAALTMPLLQLAVTTRAEVAAISRVLLSPEDRVRRERMISWLRTIGGEARRGCLAPPRRPASADTKR